MSKTTIPLGSCFRRNCDEHLIVNLIIFPAQVFECAISASGQEKLSISGRICEALPAVDPGILALHVSHATFMKASA